ncbi:hypothetical protein Acsp02_56770 [Actinoplanes sp. NBRC 103695]|nr:hypothetical protein Acsp02_56770 [Actinoplanes sp. NBRC 103695]
METGGFEEAARRVGRTGDQLAEDWDAVKAALGDGPLGAGRLGAGRLADAFRSAYRPVSEQVRTAADALPPRFTELSDAGTFSAGVYGGANTDVAGRFDLRGG